MTLRAVNSFRTASPGSVPNGGAVAQDGTSGRIDAGAVGADMRIDDAPSIITSAGFLGMAVAGFRDGAGKQWNYTPSIITSAASFAPV